MLPSSTLFTVVSFPLPPISKDISAIERNFPFHIMSVVFAVLSKMDSDIGTLVNTRLINPK